MLKLSQENQIIDLPDLNRFRIGDQVVVDASADNDRFEGIIIGIEMSRRFSSGPLEPSITLLHDGYFTDGFKPIDCRKVESQSPAPTDSDRMDPKLFRNLHLCEPAPAPTGEISQALIDVIAERRRQIETEGFDASHDDMATKGQLATAAACYAFQAGARGRNFTDDPEPIGIWPWDRIWWKPAPFRRMLVKAAGLIIAEIERLDRTSLKSTSSSENRS